MDYAAFIYLNPELCLSNNIFTVESAKFYIDSLTTSEVNELDMDLSVIPDDFEPGVYIADAGLQLNVSLLDSFIRVLSKETGLSDQQVEHNMMFADNLVQVITLLNQPTDSPLQFSYSEFMTNQNVMLNDTVQLLIDDTEYYIMTVTAIDYNAKTIDLTPRTFQFPSDGTEYRLYSVEVSDIKRIADINWVREATNRTARYVYDPEFNLYLYHLLYPDTRLMQRDAAYIDYVGRQNTDDYRAGKESDLLLNKEGFIWPTLLVEGLEVKGESLFLGPVTFSNIFNIDGDVNFEKNFSVEGTTSFFGEVSFDDPVVFNNTIQVKDKVSIDGEVVLNENLMVNDNVTISGTLGISNVATFSSNVIIEEDLNVNQNLLVSGDVEIVGTADFREDVFMHCNLTVYDVATFDCNVIVEGDTFLNQDLYVTGNTELSCNLSVQEDVHVVGNTVLNTVKVDNHASFCNTVEILGETQLENSLLVKGITSIKNTLDVDGATTINDILFVTDNARFNDTSEFVGLATMYSNLDVKGEVNVEDSVQFQDTLLVNGQTTLSNSLDVFGPSTLSNNLAVLGETDLFDSLTVYGPTTLSNDALITGKMNILNGLDISGDVTLSNQLFVNDDADFKSNVTVSNDLVVRGESVFESDSMFQSGVSITGVSSLGNDLIVYGNTDLKSDVGIEGNATLSNDLLVEGSTQLRGDATLSNDLIVQGNSYTQGNSVVQQSLAVEKDIDVSSNLTVSGLTDLIGDVSMSNSLTVLGNSEFANPVVMQSTLDVEDDASFSKNVLVQGTLDVVEQTTLSNTLHVLGDTSLDETLTVSGNTTLQQQLSVDGSSTFHGSSVFNDQVSVSDTATLQSNIVVQQDSFLHGTLQVGSTVVLQDILDVSGRMTLSNDLIVQGPSTLNDNLNVDAPASLSNSLEVLGASVVRNTFDVEGSVGLSNSFTVQGKSTFEDSVFVQDSLTVGSVVAFSNDFLVQGKSVFDDDVTITGKLNVDGPVCVTDTSEFQGEATFSNASFSNVVLSESIVIPVGDTSTRPPDSVGSIRYNTDLQAFEGFTDTVAGWSSLGGVVDGDRDTYITVEANPGDDDDTIRFFTSNELRMAIDSNGEVIVNDSLIIPVGTTADRPVPTYVGSIRYNTDLRAFEGLTDTTAGWSSLGGVIDGDRDTYITVEENPGDDDDTIRFFTSNELRMTIDDQGEVAVSNSFAVPVGDTSERPSYASVGSIRYNTDLMAFEGLTNNSSGWNSLGGVVDGDRDTFISAESNPGDNDNTLRFVTAGEERLVIDETGKMLFGTDSIQNSADDTCDYVFSGKACFCNVFIGGVLSLDGIDNLTEALAALDTIVNDQEPPYVDAFSLFPIAGTSNLGGSVSIEESGDFRVYAYASLPGEDTFVNEQQYKRFYNKQVGIGNEYAFFVGFVENPNDASVATLFSGIDVGYYFPSVDPDNLSNPVLVDNYTEYQMHIMVEDLLGRATILEDFMNPMVGVIRTNDVVAPVITESNVVAIAASPNQGQLQFSVRGIVEDGFGNTTTPPGVSLYVVALDRFQDFQDAEDAFKLVEAGCNLMGTASNYLSSTTTYNVTSYYTRNGYGDYSPETTMSNFKYYSPYILLEDDFNPPNRRILRMPDTVTFDQVDPVLGVAEQPFTDYASSNEHEFVYDMSNIIDETKTQYYTWLMPNQYSFASANDALVFVGNYGGSGQIPVRELDPYVDIEFLPSLSTGELRINDYLQTNGNYSASLNEFSQYTAQFLTVDSSNNITYSTFPAAFTKDVTPPFLQAGSLDSFQTITDITSTTTTPSVIRTTNFSMEDEFHDFQVYLFNFDSTPPDEDTIKQRIKDNIYTSSHYDITSVYGASNPHPIDLSLDRIISTGESPSIYPLTDGAITYPVILALDSEDRSDIPLDNGNANRLLTEHLSRNDEPSGCNYIILDLEAPQLDYFTVSQSNVYDPTSPDNGIGHPLVQLSYNLTDRHPLQAWVYYTTSADDAAAMQQPDAANRIVDPAEFGGMPSDGAFTDRFEVTLNNDGIQFEINEPIEENNRYYFFLGTRDYFNNRAIYTSTPPSLYITPRDPIVVNYTFDVRDNFGNIDASASGSAYVPSLSNTLDITFNAQDRGRGRLDRIFLYYTTGSELPDAPTVCNLATSLDGISIDESTTGGHVWNTPVTGDNTQDSDSQSHVTAKLPETIGVNIHVAAIDGYGNYSAVVRDNLLSALTPHAGLSYDISEPTLDIFTADIHSFDIASEDTKIDIVFSANDTGGSGIKRMYVYYTNVNQTPAYDPIALKTLAQTAPGALTGGYVVDIVGNPNSATTGIITTPDLREWTQYWVYASCEDADGNMSNESQGVCHKVQMVGNFSYSGASGISDSIMWDYQYPVITDLNISLRTDNTVRMTYTANDNGDGEPDSGLAYIYLYYTTSDVTYTVDQVVALSGDAKTSVNGGHQWDLTSSHPLTSTDQQFTVALQDSTAFYFYCVAEDRQGNKTYTKQEGTSNLTDVVTKRPIPIHGGITYDLQLATVTMSPTTEAYYTDESPDLNNYNVNVDYVVNNPGAASFDNVYLFYTTSSNVYTGVQIKENAQLWESTLTGTFVIPGSTISSSPYQFWYFYLAAFDTDTEYVRTGSIGTGLDANQGTASYIPVVYGRQIRASDNNRRSYDLNPPSMNIT